MRSRRSWSRRSGLSCSASARTSRMSSRSSCDPATASIATDLVERLVGGGYRREYQVEARGEVAVRGSIVDVYPTTADHPVRIDLWGDEVERLAAFGVADQRSTHEIDEAWIFPARELLPTEEVRARAADLLTTDPWGARAVGATRRRCDVRRHGVVAALALRRRAPPPRPAPAGGPGGPRRATSPARPRRRARRRGGGPRGGPGRHLGCVWRGRAAPALPAVRPPAGSHQAAFVPLLAAPDSPDTPKIAATAFDPVVGDTDALARRLESLRADGYRVVIAADGRGSADRLCLLLSQEGVNAPVLDSVPRRAPALEVAGISIVVAPLDRGAVVPGSKLALVAEADLTGRRRVHRAPRGARRGVDHYEGLESGDYVVHRTHGIGRYLGMESKEMFGVTRDRLVVEFKGGDRVYVDSEDIGLLRKYTGGDTPSLSKMGGSDWQKTRARVRRAVRDIAAELVVLYRRRRASGRARLRSRHPVAARDRGGLPLRGDARPAEGDRRRQGRHGAAGAHGPAGLRRRRLRQDGGRRAGRVQGGPGRQAGRGARAHDAPGQPARPDLPGALRQLSGACRGAVALPVAEGADGGRARAGRRARSTSSSAPTDCSPTTSASRASVCWSSTRSSDSVWGTRSGSRSCAPTSTS